MTNPVDEILQEVISGQTEFLTRLMGSISFVRLKDMPPEPINKKLIAKAKLALLNAVLAVMPESKTGEFFTGDYTSLEQRKMIAGYNQAIAEMTDKVKELFK